MSSPKMMICLEFAPTLPRSRHAVQARSAAGCPIIQTILEYPTTKLDNQRLQTRSPVFQPAHQATARPMAKATMSSQAELQFPELFGVSIRKEIEGHLHASRVYSSTYAGLDP